MKINGLILAAGNSSRLGQSKLLLKYQGVALLESIQTVLQQLCDQVYVVLGANQAEIKKNITIKQAIFNKNWQNGIGSSLALGSSVATNEADGLLVCLCDQPFILTTHYQLLIKEFRKNPEKIIASHYNHSLGVPAVFPARLFRSLTRISNSDTGAKSIIYNNLNQVIGIESNEAGIDIDTIDDLKKL